MWAQSTCRALSEIRFSFFAFKSSDLRCKMCLKNIKLPSRCLLGRWPLTPPPPQSGHRVDVKPTHCYKQWMEVIMLWCSCVSLWGPIWVWAACWMWDQLIRSVKKLTLNRIVWSLSLAFNLTSINVWCAMVCVALCLHIFYLCLLPVLFVIVGHLGFKLYMLPF